ncbi:hypothetical protein HLB42_21450 (plasmid) [Deinococcus sp. D7000]|nr:hypothetical protein HLB42_13725 [Deinococcus sp. D7000]QLG13507.1 hypothetical protein HLB42_21450 [Deinococcus sp. D7000]
MKDFLTKLLSKAAFAKATELVQNQPAATSEAEAAKNHKAVVDGLYAFVEDLDDAVALIPYAGPVLKTVVDNPMADAKERELCEFIVETVYRALKYGQALGDKPADSAPAPVTDDTTLPAGGPA